MVDVLLIDDEKVFLKSLAEGLRTCPGNFSVLTAGSAEQALDILRTVSVDVVVTDLNMPGMKGFELMHRLHETRPAVPIIIMSAYTRDSVEGQLKDMPFAAYIEKPANLLNIAATIKRAGQKNMPERSNGNRTNVM